MKKYIWLSSYPKSGNTMLRVFLSALFFTDDGIIDSLKLVKHISNFQNLILELPNVPSFEDFRKDLSKVCPLWIKAQKFKEKTITRSIILKTHSIMGIINKYPLTTSEYTKGFVYIIRDPRSVAISKMHHFNTSIEQSVDALIDHNTFSLGTGAPVPEIISSWKNHYLSWKRFSKEVPSLIIKYEDILTNKEKELYKLTKFLQSILSFEFDQSKFNNALNSLNFEKLKKMEKNDGFDEKLHGESFFRKGLKNEWEKEMPENLQEKIEFNFNKEMKELGYLK